MTSASPFDDSFFRSVLTQAGFFDFPDSAHDLAHLQRVVRTALQLCEGNSANPAIVQAAAWLHDCVNVPKDHPDRARASTLAGDKAAQLLQAEGFPSDLLPGVHHAIAAHSFSAGIQPETIEAKIVQDADRLDALGQIGLARTWAVGAQLGRPLYDPDDPFADRRPLDDRTFSLDHVFVKLLKLPETMQTEGGRRLAQQRRAELISAVKDIANQIGAADSSRLAALG